MRPHILLALASTAAAVYLGRFFHAFRCVLCLSLTHLAFSGRPQPESLLQEEAMREEALQAETLYSCAWFGTAPWCNGICPRGWTFRGADRSGDGSLCVSGQKVFCCH